MFTQAPSQIIVSPSNVKEAAGVGLTVTTIVSEVAGQIPSTEVT